MERNETGVANRMKRIIRTERVIPEQAAADEQVIRQVEQDLPDLTRQYWEKFGERLKTPEGMKALAETLCAMQATKNQGGGVSCVRSLCAYLERADFESAETVCLNEWDKISNYPDIAQFIVDTINPPLPKFGEN